MSTAEQIFRLKDLHKASPCLICLFLRNGVFTDQVAGRSRGKRSREEAGMKTEWDAAKCADWIDRFRRAAILFHSGQYLNLRKMETAGSNAVAALIRKLDADSTTGRDILIPLLKDKEVYVQVSSARYLILSHPELTIPLLQHLEEHDVTGADFSALNILWVYEHDKSYL